MTSPDTAILRRLLADCMPLHAAARQTLGMPAGAPTATVAQLLGWSVEEDDVPRCR